MRMKTNIHKTLDSGLTRAAALAMFAVLALSACGQDRSAAAAAEQPVLDAPVSEAAGQPETTDVYQATKSKATDRTCMASSTEVAVLDVEYSRNRTFTGALSSGDSVSALGGYIDAPLDSQDVTIRVNVVAIGAAEDDNAESVTVQEWRGTAAGLILANGTTLTEVDCDGDVSYEVERLDQLVTTHPKPPTVDGKSTPADAATPADLSQPVDAPSTSEQETAMSQDDSDGALERVPSTCLINGSDLLVLDFGTGETDPFTGVVAINDSVAAVAGFRLDPGNPDASTFLVNSKALGSAADGAPVVQQQLWDGGEGISIDGSFFSEVRCGDVAERQDKALKDLVGNNHPPVSPTPTTIRSCYIHADEIMVLDLETAYMIYTGARTNLDSVEAITGLATGVTDEGEIVLTVKSSPVGSAEDDGSPIVYDQEWLKSDFRAEILVGDQMFAEVANCDSLGERVVQLDRLVDVYPAIIE